MNKYQIGDKVWVAYCGNSLVKTPCPVCFGELVVTLILGNKDTVELPCDYCGKGYNAPVGYTQEYEYTANPVLETILGMKINITTTGEEIEYQTAFGRIIYPDIIFESHEEALKKCQNIKSELETENNKRVEYIKYNTKKTFSWNAGYHLSCAKKCRKDAEYHDKKALLCKSRIPLNGER